MNASRRAAGSGARRKEPRRGAPRFRVPALSFAAAALLAATPADAMPFAAWRHKAKITFAGYDRSAPLTDFPVLVVIGTNIPGFSYAQFSSASGGDLRFADADEAAALDFEIDEWRTNSLSLAWVKVPQLSRGPTFVWAYWGREGAALPAAATNGATWANRYRAVWHLAETAGTRARDASGREVHGALVNMESGDWTAGRLGNGLNFDGVNEYVETGATATRLGINGNNPKTVSAWVYARAFNNGGLFGCGAAAAAQAFAVRTLTTADRWRANLWGTADVDFSAASLNRWVHIALVHDDVQARVFVDGRRVASEDSELDTADGATLRIGAWQNAFINAMVDEVRVSDVARSEDWLWAAWMNAASNGVFNRYGAVESGIRVQNLAPSNVTPSEARVGGFIPTDGGGGAARAWLCWGQSDAGTNRLAWDEAVEFGGTILEGQAFSTNLAGLVPNRTYYYRAHATNSTGRSWAYPAAVFVTGEVRARTRVPRASEETGEAGVVAFERDSALTNAAATVYYTVSGSAAGGVDFAPLPGRAVIPAGATGVVVRILPLRDAVFHEGDETVRVSLAAGPYVIGSPASAEVVIEDNTFLEQFACRLKIAFAGYRRAETLTNFPVAVFLGDHLEGFNYSQFQSPSGGDLRFVGADLVTVLDHEIDTWDTGGVSVAWVRVPALARATDCVWAYWGNPRRTDAPPCATNGAVWANGFDAVWHFGETGAASPRRDATGRGRDAVPQNYAGTERTRSGRVGAADVLRASRQSYLAIAGLSYARKDVPSLTVSAWVRSSSSSNQIIVSFDRSDYWRLALRDEAGSGRVGWDTADANGNALDLGTPRDYADGQWHHICGWFRRDAAIDKRIFVDGAAVAAQAQHGGAALGSGVTRFGFIGVGSEADTFNGATGPACFLDGAVDEVRISSVARSADWIWASWMNVASNGAFLAYGEVDSGIRVVNLPVAAVTRTEVTMGGKIAAAGEGGSVAVYLCWGTRDFGTFATQDWEHVERLVTNGVTGQSLTRTIAVESNRTYFFRCYARNASEADWADSAGAFMTGEIAVEAAEPRGAEEGPAPARFVIRRPASLAGTSLNVAYDLTGTASEGLDFAAVPRTAILSSGVDRVTVTITPIDDLAGPEPDETVHLVLRPGAYAIGPQAEATATIEDNDRPPDALPGLRLWLRADSGVRAAAGADATHGQGVATWLDGSPAGRRAAASPPVAAPVFTTNGVNGRPAVRFDGASGLAVPGAPELNIVTGQTVFAVVQREDAPDGPVLQKGRAADGAQQWTLSCGAYSVGGATARPLGEPASRDVCLLTGRYTGADIEVYRYGQFVCRKPWSGFVTNGESLRVGTASGAGARDGFRGSVAELLVYDRALGDRERQRVEGYLLAKYGRGLALSGIRLPREATRFDEIACSLDVIPIEPVSDLAVRLWYREGSSGAFRSLAMEGAGGNTFRTVNSIPPGSAGVVEFYVEAVYGGPRPGRVLWPFEGAARPAVLSRFDADRRQFGPCSRRSPFTISEIMWRPRSPYGGLLEYVEIFNSEPMDHDIGGFRFSGEIQYTIPERTVVRGQGYRVIALDPASVEAFYGIGSVLGPYSGRLSNAEGVVVLRNRAGAVLAQARYAGVAPWPAQTDGAGHSLVLAKPDAGERNGQAWAPSAFLHGNPGTANPVSTNDPLLQVVINEFLARPAPGSSDFIELYNAGRRRADLSGCWLTDDPSTNKFRIPSGTVLGPRGFAVFNTNGYAMGFGLGANGDAVFLVHSNGTRVLAAARFGAQAFGVPTGRFPDGAPGLQPLVAPTPGRTNAARRVGPVVINEIMYHPLSGDSGDEYVELHNSGSNAVDLAGWRLSDGIRFTFPSNSLVPAGGYAVVAKDPARLMAAHSNALTRANTFGGFGGTLSDGGERIALVRPADPAFPDQDFVTEDEVTYGDGERWGEWADGGGSSLELRDPRSDNALAMNWAGSDETGKSTGLWTRIESTGRVDNGRGAADELQVMLLDAGECLLDDVAAFKVGEPDVNRIANPDFETGMGSWIVQGNHIASTLSTNGAHGGAQSVRLRSSGKGDNSVNRMETDLTVPFADGDMVTVGAWGRWLRGYPDVLLRFHGNGFEVAGTLRVPANLGTPGAVNSRFVPNTGPAIWDVTHDPVLPAASQAVRVTARVHDPDGVAGVEVRWRLDPGLTTASVAMTDDGAGADDVAGDGRYAALLPGQAANRLVAFCVEARDGHREAAGSRFPADAPVRECLVLFGQTAPAGSLGSYRFWITAATRAEWTSRQQMSDQLLDGTFVYGDVRAIYNAGGRYRGSPFIRTSGNPESVDSSFVFHAPKDDRLLGATGFNVDRLERDNTKLRERVAFWIADRLDVPVTYQRFVRLYINAQLKGAVHGDSQQPNGDYIECHFPDEDEGELYKVDDWFEFNDNPQVSREFNVDAALGLFTTLGGEKKKARYRWNWMKEPGDVGDDHTSLFQLADAMNRDPASAAYRAEVPALVDDEEWMRVFATRHVAGDWDGYGYSRGKNASVYKPRGGRWRVLLWDMDFSMGSGRGTTEPVLGGVGDPVLSGRFFAHPPFLRAYWRAVREAAVDVFRPDVCEPFVDGIYAAFLKNGVSPAAPTDVKTWMAGRRASLLSQLAAVAARFEITTQGGNGFATGETVVTLAGNAPVEVARFVVNGAEYPVEFTSATQWSLRTGVHPGTNVFTIAGLDRHGEPVPEAVDSIAVTFSGSAPSPVGDLVINEIMYRPAAADAEFVEIHNRSATRTYDLTGFRLNGVDFRFGPGAVLGPGGYAVVVRNATAFRAAYGSLAGLAGEYAGGLDDAGERLRLEMPGGAASWVLVDEVRYSAAPPWPAEADGGGPSLQLVDPANDNACPGNWRTDARTPCTPGAANSVRASLAAFPALRLNEVQTWNVTTAADNHGEFDPWVEVLNAADANVLAVEVHQASPDGGDLAFAASLGFAQSTTTQEVTLVARGSVWKYLDDGSDPGTAWRERVFPDGSWRSGPARLGYEDGAVTVLSYGPDPADKHIAYYFRRAWVVDRPDLLSALRVRYQRDDGLIVYLNGTEIVRDNMPPGTVTFRTLASSGAGGADETRWFEAVVDPARLLSGTNVLAVEVHQSGAGSSDLGFDLELAGIQVRFGAATEVVPPDAAWRVLDNGSDPGSGWARPSFDDSRWRTGVAPFGFGMGSEATLLPAGHVTYYFRHALQHGDAVAMNPVFRLRCDDGAVAYLNGTEIFRTNMPAGVPTPGTRALAPIEGTAGTGFAARAVSPSLFLPGSGPVSLGEVFLTDDDTNLTQWAFPADATLGPREALLVWCDGEPAESAPGAPHTAFALNAASGSVALVWRHAGVPIVLDRVDYSGLGPDRSIGVSAPDRRLDWMVMHYPTPGQPNDDRPPPCPVRVTELMYHPGPPSPPELAAGFDDPDDFEFVEVRNVGTQVVDVAALRFSRGIEFAFSNANMRFLAPGVSAVVVSRLAAFTNRYGAAVRIAGEYSGRLSNAGESLRLDTVYGEVILDFAYDDAWYPTTDGAGYSLGVVDPHAPAAAWSTKENWQPSGRLGGTPGGSTNDPAGSGIRIEESGAFTLVSESGQTDSFSVGLETQPSATVTVRLWVARGQVRLEPAELVFATSAWSRAQTVTIRAVDDAVAESNPHGDTIRPEVSSADPFYDGLPLSPVQVAILDNDRAGVLLSTNVLLLAEALPLRGTYQVRLSSQPAGGVTVLVSAAAAQLQISTNRLVFTPSDWNAARTVTVVAVDDDVDESNPHAVTVRHSVVSLDRFYDGCAAPAVVASVADNDAAGIALSAATLELEEGGPPVPYRLWLLSRPLSVVTVRVAAAGGQVVPTPDLIAILPEEWRQTQTVSLVARRDGIDEPSPHGDAVRHTIASADPLYAGYAARSVAVAITDTDTAGVVLSTSSVSVAEGGAPASYAIVLASRPTAVVTVRVVAVSGQFVAQPRQAVFTTSDWSRAQAILLSAVDDRIAEPSPVTVTAAHAVASADIGYAALAPANLRVCVTDNDTAGIRLSLNTVNLSENGGTRSYTVSLLSQPVAVVTVRVVTADGQTLATPDCLEFYPETASFAQIVSLSAVDDRFDEPTPHAGIVQHEAVSADSVYAGLRPVVLTAAIEDNDEEPAVTAHATVARTSENGGPPGEFALRCWGPAPGDLFVRLDIGGTASNAVDYQRIPTSVLVRAGSESVSVPVVPLRDADAEDEESVVVSVLPGPGYAVGFPSNAVVVIEPAPMDRWRRSVFGAAANSAAARDGADYDADGVRNLMEYVLDLNATNAETGGEFTAALEGTGSNRWLTIYYTRRTNLTDATLGIEISTDLTRGAWLDAAGFARETVLATNRAHTVIRARIVPPGPRRDVPALRLKAVRGP